MKDHWKKQIKEGFQPSQTMIYLERFQAFVKLYAHYSQQELLMSFLFSSSQFHHLSWILYLEHHLSYQNLISFHQNILMGNRKILLVHQLKAVRFEDIWIQKYMNHHNYKYHTWIQKTLYKHRIRLLYSQKLLYKAFQSFLGLIISSALP